MTEQPPDQPRRRVISPRSGAELPNPGPGRPKGSRDKPNSPRAIKYRWINEYQELCLATKADGHDNPLVWAYSEAKRLAAEGSPELLIRLAIFIFQQRFPAAVDPDQARLALRLAEIEAEGAAAAQDGGKGNQQINVILGELGEYGKTIMVPPVDAGVIEMPVSPQEIEAPREQAGQELGPAGTEQPGTWEE